MVTQERLLELLVYDPLTGLFTNRIDRNARAPAGDIAGDPTGTGYWRIQIDKRRYQAHRLAWLYVHGYFPDVQIDHRNGDRMDNRLDNLRLATNKQNHENVALRSDNGSGHRGVHWSKTRNKWVVQIGHMNKQHHVGIFTSLDDAVVASRKARDAHFTHHNTEYSA